MIVQTGKHRVVVVLVLLGLFMALSLAGIARRARAQSGCPTVSVNLPDGQYVGAVKDTASIRVQAVPSPPGGTLTFSWSVSSGPGSGTFGNNTAQDTTFAGTSQGQATLQVEMTDPPCSPAYGSANVNVIVIDSLGSISEDYYDEYTTTGNYTIPFSSSSGNLLEVLISPPSDSSNPFYWGVDFNATVNHATGTVTIQTYTSAPYMVQTVRTGGSYTFDLQYNAPAGEVGAKKKTGKTVRIAAPSQSLILTSNATDTNGFLTNVRGWGGGGILIDNVNDVNTQIGDEWTNNGNKTFSLGVIDHGNAAYQNMGGGQVWQPAGKYIQRADAGSAADLTAFMAACKGKTTSITLYGCNVALNNTVGDGPQFLQDLATGTNSSVTAYTGSIYITDYSRWYASDNGNSVTKNP